MPVIVYDPKKDPKPQFILKDSGERREFETGAQRDMAVGKGRFDLISPFFLKRLADIMEKGAIKYGDRNWEQGMPWHAFLDSAIRHLNQYVSGCTMEDHLAQAAFNIMALIHHEHKEHLAHLNDIPERLRSQGATHDNA